MFDIIDFIINHGVEVTLKYDNVFRAVTIIQKKEDHERKIRFDMHDRQRYPHILEIALRDGYRDLMANVYKDKLGSTCPMGYKDCIHDPAYIKAYHPAYYEHLFGDNPVQDASRISCFVRCQGYDYEDK